MRSLRRAHAREAIVFGSVLLALLAMPAPLLPSRELTQATQSVIGGNWKTAYLATALGMHLLFYGFLGVLAAFAFEPARSFRGRFLRFAVLPAAVTALVIVVRSAKLGFVPLLSNAIVPALACFAGVCLGLGLAYGAWKTALAAAAILASAALWVWMSSPSSELIRATHERLQRITAAHAAIPGGENRFGDLVRTAFAPVTTQAGHSTPIEHNRAAILALGIALGDERLASLVGLQPDAALMREAAAVRAGTTLQGREDWSRHYSLSAALAVLRHPFVGDAAGLMKEQLDALARGTGFSFGDLAADRAGVRFAAAATNTDAGAQSMQARLQRGFAVPDFFPSAADLPENLTVDEFRRDYGGVGSTRYRRLVAEIEARLDACPGLSLNASARSDP